MRVFTKIDGKLAVYVVDTLDFDLAINTVKGSLTLRQLQQRHAVLALVK
jgi:hypothetical protein